MATFLKGKDCSIKVGSNKVLGMGTVTLDGVTTQQLDATEFGSEWSRFKSGIKTGGTITFNGFFHADDSSGQNYLRRANVQGTEVTTLYIELDEDATSGLRYEPCQTTGYWDPGLGSTGMNTELSYVLITSFNVGAEKNGLCTASFTATVSGCMVLVDKG
jgi:hypothetical protein